LILAVLMLSAGTAPAEAHGLPSTYQTVLYEMSPRVAGLDAHVVATGMKLRLANDTGQVVLVDGYQGEPYARLMPDGTVEVNQHSPATYLNQDPDGDAAVPATADPQAAPTWRVIGHNGMLTWHDHRMHWMGEGTPPQVHDTARRTKVFDYVIPITVDGKPVAVRGTLFWNGVQPVSHIAWVLPVATVALLGVGMLALRRRTPRRPRPKSAEAW
jgi:hypothetical protein